MQNLPADSGRVEYDGRMIGTIQWNFVCSSHPWRHDARKNMLYQHARCHKYSNPPWVHVGGHEPDVVQEPEDPRVLVPAHRIGDAPRLRKAEVLGPARPGRWLQLMFSQWLRVNRLRMAHDKGWPPTLSSNSAMLSSVKTGNHCLNVDLEPLSGWRLRFVVIGRLRVVDDE